MKWNFLFVSIINTKVVGVTGVERLLRLCLAYYSLDDPNPTDFGTRQSLFAKNVSPKHFLNARTFVRFDSSFSMHNKKRHPKGYLFRYGRSDRSRTCGIHIPNVARYQLRYTPIDLIVAVSFLSALILYTI